MPIILGKSFANVKRAVDDRQVKIVMQSGKCISLCSVSLLKLQGGMTLRILSLVPIVIL